MNIKMKLVKRLNALLVEIVKANDSELDKIGVELAEIEKKLISLSSKKSNIDISKKM